MLKMIRRRRIKKQQQRPLLCSKSMTCHISLNQLRRDFSKFAVLSLAIIVCTLISEAASVTPVTNNIRNFHTQLVRQSHIRGVRGAGGNAPFRISDSSNNYHLLEQQNEYDSSSSGVSILDDDTLKLSLAIDDDSVAAGGLSSPSLHILEPKVFLRVSGESGMIKQDYHHLKDNRNNNEVLSRFSGSRASSPNNNNKNEEGQRKDLHFQSNEDGQEVASEEEEDEDDMNDNYHHHFPYIESYREKYVKPDFDHYTPSVVTTTPHTPTPQPTVINSKKDSSPSVSKSSQQGWSDLIAQVTTPSSFNEINSSASEHRLADLHIRANLPAYFVNKYSPYSEEDLENVADLDGEHSKYFVKTRPRSVTTAGSNIYSNFYYEPPSFSTKSVPIPVKTNKDKVVFASVKPTEDPQQLYPTIRTEEEKKDLSNNHSFHLYHSNRDEEAQQDSPVMTTISSNFTNRVSTLTPEQLNYDREVETTHNNNDNGDDNYSNESILKTSASSGATENRYQVQQQHENYDYYRNQQNHSGGSDNDHTKSSAETLDVSTSQSILSKVTVNNPHHPQLIIIKAEPLKTTLATPGREIITSSVTADTENNDDNFNADEDGNASTEAKDNSDASTPSTITTTTDATSIPGVPGVDYPILGEIPQTGFDCQKQRYKGFFADIDAKCQAWHYCDFTDGHSTFLCPNGTLFSQVLLTCDWWFNVDCDQARQLYVLNERLYRYIKPPKPSFPEDFIGEHVDKWLLQQFTDGYLPKVRKKSKAKLVNLPPPPTSTSTPSSTEPPAKKNDTDV